MGNPAEVRLSLTIAPDHDMDVVAALVACQELLQELGLAQPNGPLVVQYLVPTEVSE